LWSAERLSAAACAVAVAFSLSPVYATSQTDVVAGIQRYCATSWRNAGIAAQDWDDCTQDVVLLLLERIPQHRLPRAIGVADSAERRELTRSIWCVEKRWRRARKHISLQHVQTSSCVVCQDGWNEPDQREEIDSVSQTCLTKRQQRILSLSGRGWSVREIAAKLDLPTARVSDEKYKAIRKLRKHLSV
jgi:DNA-directed RNA polymerase specialized sigma24 family protein